MSEQAPAEDSTDKLIGEVLASRYQIEVRLGEGAMGTVYKARHVKVGRPFAVKVLRTMLLENVKVAQRFEREAELAGRLRHPNVVGVVDVGETPDGLKYMVMEFADGPCLAELLNEAPLAAPRITNLTRQLLEGLYHAHEQGLIHRDFKPENVIVERDVHGIEVPRIVDFGISILREGGESTSSDGRLTTNGLVLGTPHYMAPEQAVADPLDHRVDLFAVGIVVYEMLCGKLPFDGTGVEVARANLLLDPPAIAARVPFLEVDPLLEAFARLLMAKKREQRPPTAKAARELLDLIDKDRTAAAAALGVPLLSRSQVPAMTEPLAPQRRDVEGDPPARSPAVELTDELPRAKRRTWILAGVGVALVGGIAAVGLSRGANDATSAAPRAERLAVQALPPAPAPARAPEPVDTGMTADPVVTIETKPASPIPPLPQRPAPSQPARGALPTRRPLAKGTARTGPTAVTLPAPTPVATTVGKSDKVPVTTALAPSSDDADKAAVTALYRTVGRDLGKLGSAASDLWPRYRNIKYMDAMTSKERRAETLKILSQLAREIAALGKP